MDLFAARGQLSAPVRRAASCATPASVAALDLDRPGPPRSHTGKLVDSAVAWRRKKYSSAPVRKLTTLIFSPFPISLLDDFFIPMLRINQHEAGCTLSNEYICTSTSNLPRVRASTYHQHIYIGSGKPGAMNTRPPKVRPLKTDAKKVTGAFGAWAPAGFWERVLEDLRCRDLS